MTLYAIGDLHLSLSSGKPMDIFGGGWENYVEKLRHGFSLLTSEDVCILCGDLSWGMSLRESEEDFRFINELPGKKIMLKGNHDYWWSTASKTKAFFSESGITTIDILHNNCFLFGDTAVCGTRGWFYEEETGSSEHNKKIMAREIMRLRASLEAAEAAGASEKLCFFHYPPKYGAYECTEILDIMEEHNVTGCYYGHIHGPGHRSAFEGRCRGIGFRLVSADYLAFRPLRIKEISGVFPDLQADKALP